MLYAVNVAALSVHVIANAIFRALLPMNVCAHVAQHAPTLVDAILSAVMPLASDVTP